MDLLKIAVDTCDRRATTIANLCLARDINDDDTLEFQQTAQNVKVLTFDFITFSTIVNVAYQILSMGNPVVILANVAFCLASRIVIEESLHASAAGLVDLLTENKPPMPKSLLTCGKTVVFYDTTPSLELFFQKA